MRAEHDLEAMLSSQSRNAPLVVVKQPLNAGAEPKLIGNSIMLGDLKVGSIAFYMHWEPAAVQGQCRVHEDCYCTAPMFGGTVTVDDLVAWVAQGPSYRTTREHELFLPAGCYNKRHPKSRK